MTPAAREAIELSEIIVGYKTYLDLISVYLQDKEVAASRMMKEVERCRNSLDLAESGKKVALICGGDPGIYAMAGLVYEIAREYGFKCRIEVIPGIAAVNSCAARLGAPLMHDFAAVSLSDLLTPWEVIEKRLEAAASADFVIAIYNPKSKKRDWQIKRARDIILRHRDPDTPVGIVTAATREDESIVLTKLEDMAECDINMQSTVMVGNSHTYIWNEKMITPRGYRNKYRL